MYDIRHIDAETGGKHAVTAFARAVETAMSANGHEVDLVGRMTQRAAAVEHDGMVTPDLSDDVWDFIRSGEADFSLNHLLENEDHTGTKAGAANVTSIAEQEDMTIGEVVEALIEDGQIADAIAALRFLRDDSDPSAKWLVAYILLTYGKGWEAEKLATRIPGMSAGGITNDQAGQDVRWDETGEYLQLKPMTTYAKNSKEYFRNKDVRHIFYQWTADGGIKFAPLEKANEMSKGIAKEDKVSATLIKIKHSSYKHPVGGDRYQLLSW